MKNIYLTIAGALALLAVTFAPANATHTMLHSPPTKGCVPAIVSLLWYDKYYAPFFIGAHKLKNEVGGPTNGYVRTPACWLGVASAALAIPHRKLYTPNESRMIRQWFKERTGHVVTGTTTGTTASN